MSSSSTTNPLKHSADELNADKPSVKKTKVAEADSGQKKVNINNNDNELDKPTPNKSSLNGNNHEAAEANPTTEEQAGSSENNFDGFDPKVTKALETVESIQQEIFKLNEKASEEILKVEQKFNKLRRPHFEKRNEILKEVQNFWLTSLANHPTLAPMIESAQDEDCLHYLINLDVEEFEDIKSGYKLKLYFAENPYINNDVIVKQFQIVSSEEVLSFSTPIEYKNTPQAKQLKEIVETSVAQYRRAGRRPGESHQSFFAWLSEPSDSGTDEIADILKDQIWPNPMEYFFASPDDYEAGSEEDSDDEDEEIDDDIDDDDDDDGIIGEGQEFSDDEELDDEEGGEIDEHDEEEDFE